MYDVLCGLPGAQEEVVEPHTPPQLAHTDRRKHALHVRQGHVQIG